MRRNFAILALVVSWSAPRAEAGEWEIGIGGGTNWTRSQSVDAVTSDDIHGVMHLRAGRRLGSIEPLGVQIGADIELESTSLEGTSFRTLDTSLSTTSMQVGGRVWRPLNDRFSAFGRLGVGYTSATFQLDDGSGSGARPVSDDARAALASLSAGVDTNLISSSRHSLTIGLRLEGGYARTSTLEFRAVPEESGPDSLTIDTVSAPLGGVNPSAWRFRMAAFARF